MTNQKIILNKKSDIRLLLLSLLFSIIITASLKAEIFSIQLDWKQGEKYIYDVTESHIVYRDKLPIMSNIQRSKISLEFYRINDDYNKLRWRYVWIQADTNRINDYTYKSLYNLSNNLSFDIITDKHGVYQYLINWEQIRDLGTTFIDSVISKLPEHYQGNAVNAAKAALLNIRKQYESHDAIEAGLMQNILIFLQAYSYNYDNSGPIEQDAVMENPLTKEMVSGKLIRIGIIKKPERLLSIDIKQLVQDSVKAKGFDTPQILELLFKTSVDIDTSNGTVKDLSYSRQVLLGNQEDVKSVFIRRSND